MPVRQDMTAAMINRAEALALFRLPQGDWHMPKLRQHLAQGGINFTNYIANFAVCW